MFMTASELSTGFAQQSRSNKPIAYICQKQETEHKPIKVIPLLMWSFRIDNGMFLHMMLFQSISVRKTFNEFPYVSRSRLEISFAQFVLLSTMVKSMPSICKPGLICFLTFFTVCNHCSNPFAGKYSACTGIRIQFAAANAFTVSIPSDG